MDTKGKGVQLERGFPETTLNVLLAGIGGQGVLTASQLLAEAADDLTILALRWRGPLPDVGARATAGT